MASVAKRPDGRYRARYRDPSGREHSKHFVKQREAQRWLDEVTTSMVTGQYVDPNAGRQTFKVYAENWRNIQVHRPSTRAQVEHLLTRHVYPVFGDRPLVSLVHSDMQSFVRRLEVGTIDRGALAPATIAVAHSIVSAIMKAAVKDRRIPANPCEGVKLPEVEKRKVVPLSMEQVYRLEHEMPAELTAMVTLAAGTGVRIGEASGLTVDRLDFLRREVTIDRQLLTRPGATTEFGPPKTKASNRVIPLPQVVVDSLAAHLAAYPADPRETGLVFTLDGLPITRQRFGHVWRSAVYRAKLPKGTGFHALRHHYASLLIEDGRSVKTVQERLGHKSATETWDTYSHLFHDDDTRTRDAVDAARARFADSLRTGSTS